MFHTHSWHCTNMWQLDCNAFVCFILFLPVWVLPETSASGRKKTLLFSFFYSYKVINDVVTIWRAPLSTSSLNKPLVILFGKLFSVIFIHQAPDVVDLWWVFTTEYLGHLCYKHFAMMEQRCLEIRKESDRAASGNISGLLLLQSNILLQ